MGLEIIKYFYLSQIFGFVGYSGFYPLREGSLKEEYIFFYIDKNNPIKKEIAGTSINQKYFLEDK